MHLLRLSRGNIFLSCFYHLPLLLPPPPTSLRRRGCRQPAPTRRIRTSTHAGDGPFIIWSRMDGVAACSRTTGKRQQRSCRRRCENKQFVCGHDDSPFRNRCGPVTVALTPAVQHYTVNHYMNAPSRFGDVLSLQPPLTHKKADRT